MREDTYAHTALKNMFDDADVYGISPNEDRKKKPLIRLAILGCGGVAQSKHIPAIQRLQTLWEPVELCAVCMRNQEQGKKIEQITGAKWYADFHALLDRERPDGVLVLAADAMHFEMTMECLGRGIPVLVEKPICRSLRQSREMVDAAASANVTLMTVSNKRYSPPYYRAKKWISDGTIPNPALFSGKFNLGYDYVDLLEGGTVHLFDLMRFLMGNVVSVSGLGVRKYSFNRTGYPFDNAVLQFRLESGAVGSIVTSTTALSLHPWERVEIYAEKRWMSVEDQYRLELHDTETGGTKVWTPVIPNTLLFDEEFGGFMGLIDNFLGCIRGEETPVVTGEDGYRAYELCVASHLAIASGKTIRLPLSPTTADAELSEIFERAKVCFS